MEPSKEVEYFNRLDLLDQLLDYAVKAELIDDNNSERDILGSKIMNLITPLPSEVNDIFWSLYESDKKEATDYFYKLGTQNNYIKSRSIAQNIAFEHDTEFGTLQLTINLSKPEKTRKEIEESKNNTGNYPVKWPMSVIRLKDNNRDKLVEAASVVIDAWRNYTNEDLNIRAVTGGTPHNAITPLTRKDGDQYVVDLVLRNNCTSDEYPDGIFHPYPEVHPIKKENIGLIEVLGLAILPPRLKKELEEVRFYLVNQTGEVPSVHKDWVEEMLESGTEFTEDNVEEKVNEKVGEIFLVALKNAGVFKTDQEGQEAFKAFVDQL